MNDLAHFSNLSPPLSPNKEEIEIYKTHIPVNSTVLLLGYTKELLDLADTAIDINPIPHEKVKRGNWFDITDVYDVIIGDGVLNLAGGILVEKLLKYTRKILIIRFFPEKLKEMKYATHFKETLINIKEPDIVIPTNESCILIWKTSK